jgi:hypothetical protein
VYIFFTFLNSQSKNQCLRKKFENSRNFKYSIFIRTNQFFNPLAIFFPLHWHSFHNYYSGQSACKLNWTDSHMNISHVLYCQPFSNVFFIQYLQYKRSSGCVILLDMFGTGSQILKRKIRSLKHGIQLMPLKHVKLFFFICTIFSIDYTVLSRTVQLA